MRLYEIKENSMKRSSYFAYELDDQSRNTLMSYFIPKYDDVIGHHITYKFGVSRDEEKPNGSDNIYVVGYTTDNKSIEALIVEVDNSTKRPDGKTFHITWSLDRTKGRKPMHSNDIINEFGWTPVKPIKISATMKAF